MGVTLLVFELSALKAKIKGFLAGHIVAMVTYLATKLTALVQFVDAMIVALTDMSGYNDPSNS